MPRIQQPVASVKLTNVATVRLTINGQRFEIACYKNKILDYRAGLETDLSEVLQTDRIFSNVVKGEFASTADMKKAFGKDATEEEIALIILNKGKSLQVSEAERTQLYESTIAQVATWLATNCFHKTTGKPFTMSQVKQALTSTTYSVQPHKPIKQQYLQALKHLQASGIPIQRAAMELSWTYSSSDEEKVRDILQELNITARKQESKLILTVDPSLYRPLNQKAPPNSMIEVLRQHVMDAPTNIDISDTNTTTNADSSESALTQQEASEQAQEDSSANSDIDESYIQPSSRSKKKKGKKQQRKAERRRQQQVAAQSSDDSEVEPVRAVPKVTKAAVEHSIDDSLKKWKCNSCPGSSFASAAEHRAHFKTDWHRFNQKLKMKGASTVTEEEFRSCDIDSFFGDTFND